MLNPSRNLINTTTITIPIVLALVLIISSQLSFLLFHTLAEFFAIIVALLSAVVAWQMYTFTRNHFLMYLGCGYFWIASLDMLHTLSYEGLPILETTGTNVAVQFWIGTRILEALLLLSSPWFLTRPVNPKIAISLFAFISVSLTALILTKNFPIGFIEGKGLTDFKIYSEYLIILILAGAIYYLSLQRRLLDQRIFKLIVASIALTMMAELSFTFYVSIYGLSNISGHIFKLFSFWLIFIAVVRTTLREPFSAMSKAETHYDAIPDAAIIVDNKGIIQHVNKAACSLANLTSIELIGQQAHHIFHNKNENESLCNICNSVKNRTELSAYELEFSETTWFDISISPIDGEESLIEVIRNITEKKQTANALKKSEAQLRTLIESLPDLIWLKDSNGVYLSCNLKFEKLYGAKEADILGKTDYDFVDRDLADFFRKNDRLAMAAGKPTTNEEELTYASDGHTEFLETIKTPMRDSNGDLIGVLGIARDISERKKMENALLESENNLVRGQEIAKLGNWKLIPETGEISGSNELLNIYGITHNELTLENITSLAHPDDRNYDLVHIKNGIEHGVPWDIEHRILLKDGSVKWIHAVGEPLQDNNKKTVSIIGIVQDITERKLADEVLRRSQKMDALGKLTGGIAHDFNNMLGVVLGYSELLIEMLHDNPKLLTYANEVHRAGERGAKLTQKLLSSSRQKASSSEQINFNALLQDGTHMLEKTLTARIHLTLELEKNLWATWLDASDFEDAVLNLSINAMHAISDNGELTFRTSNKFINENTARSLHLSPGEYACLSVIDTGCGIDEATTERIFEPFFTTKDNLLSSGLGLAQVYGFVERSGGAISVNSQPGQGTQFDLYFPRYQTTEPTTTDTKTSTSVNYNGNETILIVDDEPALLHLTHEVLSLYGYHVITAQSGKQALEVLENEHIDLLLSDVIMPEMDGYQLATIVQEKYPVIKIQLASGFTDDRHNNKINDFLNQNILHKPYETEMLLKRIRSLLSEHPGQQPDQLSSKQTDQPKEKGETEAVEKEKEKEKIIKKDKQPDKEPGSLANSTQTRRTIMIMDDEDDIRALFKLNLEKLNYETILAKNGDEAIEIYQQSLENNKTIDAIIMDLSIPGGMNGSEVAKKLRILNPSAKLIVASGHNTGPEMVNHLEHGFDAAIEKNFDRRSIRLTLEKLFATH